MRQRDPATFAKAVELDVIVQEKAARLIGGPAYLHEAGPLDQVVVDQLELFEDDANCESGYCMT